MKLLVVVLCLLSERYFIYGASSQRFNWFLNYVEGISNRFQNRDASIANQALLLSLVVVPIVLLSALTLFLLGFLFFGLMKIVLHLVIFYYCLGPENPFYPPTKEKEGIERGQMIMLGDYFAKMNGALFAIIFWYFLLGPLSILFYRLVSLCKDNALVAPLAQKIVDFLNWLPARFTSVLYLLVGNFQRGFPVLRQQFFSVPEANTTLLSCVGLLAVKANENETVSMLEAENLVLRALVLCLVFFAAFSFIF